MLTDHLRHTGYDDATIEASGLALRSSRGNLIDRFRDRAILPIRDREGAVIAFIGRVHPDAGDNVPRYLNSPETAIYRKSDVLYGLAEGRAALAAGARPVLVEGPLDAIAVTDGAGGRGLGLAPCATAAHRQPRRDPRPHAAVEQLASSSRSTATPVAAPRRCAAFDLLRGPAPELLPRASRTVRTRLAPSRREGPAALTETLVDSQRLRPPVDLVIDHRIDGRAERLQFAEGQLSALRSVAPLIAALPPDTVGRHIMRVAERLELDHATMTGEVLPQHSPSGARPFSASALAGQSYPQPYHDAARTPAYSASRVEPSPDQVRSYTSGSATQRKHSAAS